jgi:deazaflavin-dependent oxidoreductase (nitroreductase family)
MPVFRTDSAIGRATRRMATSNWFRKVGPRVVPPMDRAMNRLTKGRFVFSKLMVPSLVLTTTGQKSGLARETPLACVPDDTGWYIVGSNFGREKHPAWTGNLLAHPRAAVTYEGDTVEVDAHLLSAEEKAERWAELIAAWPAYDDYVEVSGRDLRVFHLTPAATD